MAIGAKLLPVFDHQSVALGGRAGDELSVVLATLDEVCPVLCGVGLCEYAGLLAGGSLGQVVRVIVYHAGNGKY